MAEPTLFDYVIYSYQKYMIGSGEGTLSLLLTGILILASIIILSTRLYIHPILLALLLLPLTITLLVYGYINYAVAGIIILVVALLLAKYFITE